MFSHGAWQATPAVTIDMDRRYLPPTAFAALSAILYVIALPLSGFSTDLGPSVVGSVIWAALALGLFRESRTVAYLAFLMALVGISAALGIAMGTPAGPVQWIWIAIVGADTMVAATVFLLLWRSPSV